MSDIAESSQEIKPPRRKATPRPDRWFPFYAEDWLHGTRQLSPGARGVYLDILCLIYMRKGSVPDDNRWITCSLHIGPRRWLKLRKELFDAGKLEIGSDGGIINGRAMEEISAQTRTQTRPESRPKLVPKLGPSGRRLSNKINGHVSPSRARASEGEEEVRRSPISSVESSGASLPDHAVLSARLHEAGGEKTNRAVAGFLSLAPVYGWLEQGCDLDKDVLPAIRSVCARANGARILSWSYFTPAVTAAKKQRETPLPPVDIGRSNRKDHQAARMAEAMEALQKMGGAA